jgi:hypothetical protein
VQKSPLVLEIGTSAFTGWLQHILLSAISRQIVNADVNKMTDVKHVSIVEGSREGDFLCQRCAEGATIDDAASEFYEGTREDGKATLRHKDEGTGSSRLSSVIRWADTLPDLGHMEASAAAGCQLCRLVRTAVLRRNIARQGPVNVLCAYVWGGNRDKYDVENDLDDGLVYLRCEVFSQTPKIEKLAYIVFLIETKDGGQTDAWNLTQSSADFDAL